MSVEYYRKRLIDLRAEVKKEQEAKKKDNTLNNEDFQGVIVADDDNAPLDESAANKLFGKIDWVKFATKIATSKLGKDQTLAISFINSLTEQKPKNVKDFLELCEGLDYSQLTNQLKLIIKKIPSPFIRMTLKIILKVITKKLKIK